MKHPFTADHTVQLLVPPNNQVTWATPWLGVPTSTGHFIRRHRQLLVVEAAFLLLLHWASRAECQCNWKALPFWLLTKLCTILRGNMHTDERRVFSEPAYHSSR
jgi:hypothetical protein